MYEIRISNSKIDLTLKSLSVIIAVADKRVRANTLTHSDNRQRILTVIWRFFMSAAKEVFGYKNI